MATSDPLLLLVLLLNFLLVIGVVYVLFRIYRSRNRKVKKLR